MRCRCQQTSRRVSREHIVVTFMLSRDPPRGAIRRTNFGARQLAPESRTAQGPCGVGKRRLAEREAPSGGQSERSEKDAAEKRQEQS
jgi:hypothetical protein